MKWLRQVVSLWVLLPAAIGASAAAEKLVAVADFDSALLAQEVFRATNAARAKQGVVPLVAEPRLRSAADSQAATLAMRVHTGHHSPILGQGDPSSRVQQSGMAPGTVAENAATMDVQKPNQGGSYTYTELAEAIVQAWMDSPGHRANLLDPTFHFLGCGTRIAWSLKGEAVVYAIQDFYSPARVSDPPPTVIRPNSPSLSR
jgi:uncharacterized protein YkwD